MDQVLIGLKGIELFVHLYSYLLKISGRNPVEIGNLGLSGPYPGSGNRK